MDSTKPLAREGSGGFGVFGRWWLMSLKKELLARILGHPDIELRKSRFAKEDALFVGTREIAHFHHANELDVRLTKAEIKRRGFAKGEEKRVRYPRPAGDWVEVTFRKEADLAMVVELLEAAAKENRKR